MNADNFIVQAESALCPVVRDMKMKILVLLIHFSFEDSSESSEEERLGFYPGVETVYCECAINVILKGDARDLTFAEAPGRFSMIFPSSKCYI